MTTHDAIKTALSSGPRLWERLIDDFTDADMLVRPVPGANHAAWQLGHLIASEIRSHPLIGAVTPPLPEGFSERHAAASAGSDKASDFLTKQEYMKLFADVRTATLAAIDKMADADFEKPNPGPTAPVAPTIGALLLLTGSHGVMHVGQVSVIRRKLGKSVKF